MGTCYSLTETQQLIVSTRTTKKIVDGPKFIGYSGMLNSCTKVDHVKIPPRKYAIFRNTKTNLCKIEIGKPKKDENGKEQNNYIFHDPYEELVSINDCPVLSQDEYVLITHANGTKSTIAGPYVFVPAIGDKYDVKNVLFVKINEYIIVENVTKVNEGGTIKQIKTNTAQKYSSENRDETDEQKHELNMDNDHKSENQNGKNLYEDRTQTYSYSKIHVFGPLKYIPDPYDTISGPYPCPSLDQDDYVIVRHIDGMKDTIKGPDIYKPAVGDELSESKNAIIVHVNTYIIVDDNKNGKRRHLRGPLKFIPEPYDTIVTQFPLECEKITSNNAIWLHKKDGEVLLISEPQYFMPDVGDKVIKQLDKTILKQDQFCIIVKVDGQIILKDGNDEESREFFQEPYSEFYKFKIGDNIHHILSKLPQYFVTDFDIRTHDNNIIKLTMRVHYEITDSVKFSKYPIEFEQVLKNWCQNELLDAYADVNFENFFNVYYKVAHDTIDKSHEEFDKSGIVVNDIQILSYKSDKKIETLLEQNIEIVANARNKLKSKQIEIELEEKDHEIQKKRLNLDIEMTTQKLDMEIKKKILQDEKEYEIKIKQMELERNKLEMEMKRKELEFEMKRKEIELDSANKQKEIELKTLEQENEQKLLELKRKNDIIDIKSMEGQAIGAYYNGFVNALSSFPEEDRSKFVMMIMNNNIDIDKLRLDIERSKFMFNNDIEKTRLMYDKIKNIDVLMHPDNTKFMNVTSGLKSLTNVFHANENTNE